MMNKTILFSAATCILMMLSANRAFAYDFSAVNNGKTIYYNITSSSPPLTVEVTDDGTGSYTGSYSGNVSIPDTVTNGGNTYSVTAIGDWAFAWCYGLTSVTIPNSVTTIGDYAFYTCHRLTSVTVGYSVTVIGDEAFGLCSGLTEIHVKAKTPPQINEYTFMGVSTAIAVYVCTEVEDYRNAEYWKNFTNILQDNDCDMAVEDLVAEDSINIYPNPATDNIFISLREMITEAVFTLYDMQGRVLIRREITGEDMISVNEFAAGIYIYNVRTAKGTVNGKIAIGND
ncbi:MAG: leucine-rich repeat domain-containing protein [Bacteroidales bacterium]|jgi:hypothetical protein|nr:leucine-rich repeat domain-containing protein [Bacteroidales bacterium]